MNRRVIQIASLLFFKDCPGCHTKRASFRETKEDEEDWWRSHGSNLGEGWGDLGPGGTQEAVS